MEIISFDVPEGFSDKQIIEDARSVVDHWKDNPDLIRKHMAKSDEGEIIGVYLWPNEEVARKAHNQVWVESFQKRTGATPKIQYCKLFMVIDNKAGTVDEYGL